MVSRTPGVVRYRANRTYVACASHPVIRVLPPCGLPAATARFRQNDGSPEAAAGDQAVIGARQATRHLQMPSSTSRTLEAGGDAVRRRRD